MPARPLTLPAAHPVLRAPFELKAASEAERTFEGLASTWNLDNGGDIVVEGAFARTLEHWKSSGRVVPLLDHHYYRLSAAPSVVGHTLGKMIEAEETSEGLWTKYSVAKTGAGDDLLALLKDGMVEGLSIGYAPIPDKVDYRNGIRYLREVKLGEVSVVTFGMNDEALIDLASVKSLLDRGTTLSPIERAELEELRHRIAGALKTASSASSGDDDNAPKTTTGDSPDGLAPDSPRRRAIEAAVRGARLRDSTLPAGIRRDAPPGA